MARQITPRQLELLLDFLEEHQSLALGKVRGREGNALSKRLWRQCADILNADAGGLSKSGPEWKKYYNQYKSRTKAKLRQIKEGRTRTGGGPAPHVSLFPLEERLISIVGGCSSPLPVRQNPLDTLSFEPATNAEHDLIIVQQDADLPTARQIDIEYLEVLSDAASCSENGVAGISREPVRDRNPSCSENGVVAGKSREPVRDRNPPKRRRRPRRSSSPNGYDIDNKKFEAAQQQLMKIEQSRIEVDRELARAMNRHASAMEEIAGAANRFVGLYEETLRLRQRSASNSSISSIRIAE